MKINLSGCVCFAFAVFLHSTDATITSWTTPVIAATAADGTGTLAVQETQAVNTAITTYVAVTDQTPNNSITYALDPAVSPFALSTGGELTITAALDADTTSTYTLNVVATDSASASGTATITVSVSDIPAFGAASYTQCITDGSVAAGNTNTDFTINGTTGVIKVATGKTLAAATTPSYSLVIHAVVNETPTAQTGSTTVSVTVAAECSSAAALGFSVTAIFVTMLVSVL